MQQTIVHPGKTGRDAASLPSRRSVYGKHLGGYAAVVDVDVIEGVVVGRGSYGGCDAEGGAEGEFGFACEVEAEDAALVSLGGEFHCVSWKVV